MGVDAAKALAKSDKNSNMQNGIRRQLVELNAVHKQQPTKKFVGWEGQTSDEEVEEDDSPPIAGAGNHFVAREAEGILISENAHLLHLLMVRLT